MQMRRKSVLARATEYDHIVIHAYMQYAVLVSWCPGVMVPWGYGDMHGATVTCMQGLLFLTWLNAFTMSAISLAGVSCGRDVRMIEESRLPVMTYHEPP
jgi:hypothetical protein